MKKKTKNAFIFMWDIFGVESIVPITEFEYWDEGQLIEILKGNQTTSKPNPISTMIASMKLRARYNTQRHYEIYAIDCDSDISKEDWESMWQDNPQSCADLIRERGLKIHSDRANYTQKVF